MRAGELYNALYEELVNDRMNAHLLIKELNDTREDQTDERRRILKSLIPDAAEDLWLQPLSTVTMVQI
jgi:maltose O-acetyltransferase